ncbi:hypothetical protein BTJ39_23260 [Izhakiella australiensis]|uniref:Nodulation protein E n=1 Tax=Izhakiella australiensis TaxID=1926881 RepID=A0A1S8Y6L2_9GAMM|nr:beta-ketoacyl-[acyl-carrier-protein] synthase family protein [Izhakiella australiensis]OON34731.1 hypothetical protein BTJ39_23260 [Izhakiella australiensis]
MSIVITGAGCVSPLGLTTAETWQAMRDGVCAIHPLKLESAIDLSTPVAAQVKGYDPEQHFTRKELMSLDRSTQFALMAAKEAVAQARLSFDDVTLRQRTGVIIGSANGAESTRETLFAVYHQAKNRSPIFSPLSVPRLMFNAPSAQISMFFGLQGPAFAVSSACASANHALIQAAGLLTAGLADIVIVGATEASITPGFIRAWESLRALSSDTCRPFCTTRSGLVIGEGAGVFVLERETDAAARGATILARLAGFGMSSDAGHLTQPNAEGMLRAMQQATEMADISPQELDYINAHGTGTRLNDVTEAKAIVALLGSHAERAAVSSTKSAHGHLMGAAGAVELIAVLGALNEGVIPPTLNMQQRDVECNINIICQPEKRVLKTALSNSFAFGGMNAVLALRYAAN